MSLFFMYFTTLSISELLPPCRAPDFMSPKLCTRRVPVGLNWERVWVGVAFASLPILG